mmetsp:Transcript_68705/g.119344  ORF Transcript_68705/g.119344 Transcript_68705/m.119344 type:complete len:250 (-) Transcript_68705:129-878(-)
MGNNSSSEKTAIADAAANKAPPEDYYEVLGLRMDADKEKMKKAYLKESEKWHYSSNIDEAHKAYFDNRFRLVSEAYQVLSDDRKRAMYGQYGPGGLTEQFQDPQVFWREQQGITELCRNTVPLDGEAAQPTSNLSARGIRQGVSNYVAGMRQAMAPPDTNAAAELDANMDILLAQTTEMMPGGGKGRGRGRRGGRRGRGMSEEQQLQAAIQASNMHALQGGMDEETALAAALQASQQQAQQSQVQVSEI